MDAPTALRELMDGYFHQDWDSYGDDSRQVVEVFASDHPELAESLPREIENLLLKQSTEPELQSLLWGMGCQTDPLSEDGSYRTWLIELAVYARDLMR